MTTDERILRVFDVYGFDEKLFRRMCKTRKSIMSVDVDINGKMLRKVALFTNHYINGHNHWAFKSLTRPNLPSIYFSGDNLNELVEAEFEIRETIKMPEYEDYIKKFNPYEVIEVIELYPIPNYRIMPKPPRQDNKSIRVGSGNGRNDIRFPSKKRGKSTWKRFWKLFPEYDGCYTKKEYYRKQLERMKQFAEEN